MTLSHPNRNTDDETRPPPPPIPHLHMVSTLFSLFESWVNQEEEEGARLCDVSQDDVHSSTHQGKAAVGHLHQVQAWSLFIEECKLLGNSPRKAGVWSKDYPVGAGL